jgi:hypothetical protein
VGLREIEFNDMDWIVLAPDMDQWKALVNTILNLRASQNAGKFLSSCKIRSFSRKTQLHERASK